MREQEPTRKLTTILCADAAGYSRMMRADEEGTYRSLRACRDAFDRLVGEHHGRIFGAAGDSVLAEFPSPVEAVRCAAGIQQSIDTIAENTPETARLRFRMGINLGDVLVQGDDLIGDGVNIAARLQGLAQPGEIFISAGIFELVKNTPGLAFDDLGKLAVKNIAEPVHVHRVRAGPAMARLRTAAPRSRWSWARALLGASLVAGALAGVLGVGWYHGYLPLPRIGSLQGAGSPQAGHASIIVLPFENLSGDVAQDYFADGITEDITLALGRFSDLSVIAREAAQQFKGKPPQPGELGRALRVRYVLQGSARRDGERVRVTAMLSDAQSSVQLWSDRYDGEVKDVFSVQDDITQKVVGALAIKLNDIERQRSLAKPPENLQAYDYLLRGRDYFLRRTRADNSTARRMFETAIQLDPNYAAAYVALGYTRVAAAFSGWTEQVAEAVEQAQQYGQKALELDSGNAEAHALLGSVYLNLGQGERAVTEIRQAVALNPSDANSYALLGGALTYNGQPAEGVEAFELAMRLNPDMGAGRFTPVGWAYYLVGRYEDAVRVQEAAVRKTPNEYFIHAGLAASYAQLGRMTDAKRAAQDTLRTWPFFRVDEFADQFAGIAQKAVIKEGLRQAGLK